MTIVEAPVELLPAAALLVGDQRIEDTSGGMHEHIYPATGKRTASIPLAGAAEMSAVVGVARTALAGWRSTPANTRRRLLLRFAALIREYADELSRLTTLDNGTPEIRRPVHAGNGGGSVRVQRRLGPTRSAAT